MACTEALTLRQSIGAAERFFFDRNARTRITDLAGGTSLDGRRGELAGKSVLVATESQLTTALIELDGAVRRLTILPPDADPDHLAAIIAGADIDAVVLDRRSADSAAFDRCLRVVASAQIAPAAAAPLAAPARATEWVMLTSG